MQIRPVVISDYPKLVAFWKANYLLTPLDEYKRIKLFLGKNKDLSILAEENGKIIGTVLGSFDGRRGSLQKIVVKKDQRGNGIGQILVKEVVKKLDKL
ncbi:MAG: GNAT family N-acetyltransferase [Candidatus Levyibacteriota bacterium]